MADQIDELEVHVTMADGSELDTEILNPDMLRYDRERPRRKFAGAKDSPVEWLTFVSWASLTRTKQIEGMPWEAFQNEALRIRRQAVTAVDPTRPVPGPD